MGERQQRYRVIEKIASGGMAEVFRAESAGIEGFKKTVAIKRVLPHLSKHRKFIAMFLDEARLSAQLNHSNVVQVFDIGIGDKTYFIVLEYVDGADLKAIIETLRQRRVTFPLHAAIHIAIQIAEGLSYAHELKDADGNGFGIVHRDVSPPNVIITRYGEVKLMDFGLAKANNQLEKSEPGIIKGKFSYLAPEAAMGHEVDARVDIFAVGIILWEMLAGRRLFMGESDYDTVRLVQQAKIPSLMTLNPQVPAAVDRVLAKALARDVNQRYPTARQLADDLLALLFTLGKPVGPRDIANLVAEARREKDRSRPDRANIIDRLIKEALFEFTSLQDGSAEIGSSGSRHRPSGTPSPDISGLHNWERDLSFTEPYSAPSSNPDDDRILSSIEELEMGNLSALEDLPMDSVPNSQRILVSAPTTTVKDAAANARAAQPPSYGMPAPSSPGPLVDTEELKEALSSEGSPEKRKAMKIVVGSLGAVFLLAVLIAAWYARLLPF